jgi:hypothetical protein
MITIYFILIANTTFLLNIIKQYTQKYTSNRQFLIKFETLRLLYIYTVQILGNDDNKSKPDSGGN